MEQAWLFDPDDNTTPQGQYLRNAVSYEHRAFATNRLEFLTKFKLIFETFQILQEAVVVLKSQDYGKLRKRVWET